MESLAAVRTKIILTILAAAVLAAWLCTRWYARSVQASAGQRPEAVRIADGGADAGNGSPAGR